MHPIILKEEEPTTKTRKIVVYKASVYKDIDVATYKYTDANPNESPQQNNAESSDTTEALDRSIITSLVSFRDGQLRNALQTVLEETDETGVIYSTANDTDDTFTYTLVLPVEFRDTLLRPVSKYIHRYLVYGALYDWYIRIGRTSAANAYLTQLDELERDILTSLRTPSKAKRPLQPFGPAGKVPPINFM